MKIVGLYKSIALNFSKKDLWFVPKRGEVHLEDTFILNYQRKYFYLNEVAYKTPLQRLLPSRARSVKTLEGNVFINVAEVLKFYANFVLTSANG